MLVGLFFVLAGNAIASIGVEPAVTELEIPAGGTSKGALVVGNDSNDKIKVRIEPEEWKRVKGAAHNFPIDTWLFFDTYEIEILPKSVKKVEYTIKMPKDLKGELMSEVFFSEINNNKQAIGFSSRFGVAIYAISKGSEIYNLEITAINVRKGILRDAKDKSISVYAKIKNNGNIHVRPTSTGIVYDVKGKVVKELKFQYGPPVFPFQDREYAVFWKDPGLKEGIYRVVLKTTFDDREIAREKIFSIGPDGMLKDSI